MEASKGFIFFAWKWLHYQYLSRNDGQSLPFHAPSKICEEWSSVCCAQTRVKDCDVVHAYMLRTLDLSSKLVRKQVEEDRAANAAVFAGLAQAAANAHDSRALYQHAKDLQPRPRSKAPALRLEHGSYAGSYA